MGAVYVSDGFSSVGAETFFNKIIKPFFDQHITLESISHHPTKVLLESLQSMGCVDFKIERVDISPDADGHTAESIGKSVLKFTRRQTLNKFVPHKKCWFTMLS